LQIGAASGAGNVNITPASAIVGLAVVMAANDSVGINIDTEAAGNYGFKILGKYGAHIRQDVSGGNAFTVIRNLNEAGSEVLAILKSDHTATEQSTLFIDHDGTGGATGYGLHVDSENAAAPAVLIESAYFAATTVGLAIGDVDTGIGQSAADQMSLIAGGVEFLELVEGTDDYMDAKGMYINQLQNIPDLASKGAGYWFDGVDDYVEKTSAYSLDESADVTFLAVIKTNSSSDQGIMEIGNTQIGMGLDGGYLFSKTYDAGGPGTTNNISTLAVSSDEWHTVTNVYTAGTVAFYVDGKSGGDAVVSLNEAAAGQYIRVGDGEVQGAGVLFSGEVSRALVFNLALTAAEVRALSSGAPVPFKYVGASQTEQTSGTLTIGKRYRIKDWITADDFTNIGGTNTDGNEFTATGTTPTTWTNSSVVVQIGAVLNLDQSGIKAGTWVDSSGNDLHGALSGVVPINLPKGEVQLLSITTVPFNANGDTALITTPSGYTTILDHAKIVAGADAVSTDITIGANGAETDFLPTNQMDNLDASGDVVTVMPIPNTTPLQLQTYAAGTVIDMNVANQAGGATNTVYLYGILY